MAAGNTQTNEPDETTQDAELNVEFDKMIDVEGELVENPVIEEVADDDASTDEETNENAEDDDKNPEETGSDTDSERLSADDESEKEESAESTPELKPEKDEAGVYEPIAKDPGEFQPKGDYSFEVTTKDGKTVKISTPEEAEKFADRIDSEDDLLSARQFVQFNRNFSKMDRSIEKEESDYKTEKEQFDTQTAAQEVRDEQIQQWNNGLNYLQAKGKLPEIAKGVDVPGGWEKNPDDPGVKARMDIFKWMEVENKAREAAGIDEITNVVDAFGLMQAEQESTAADTERKAETKARQKKGSMVGGNAPYTPEQDQKGSIIGTGGSLRDLEAEYTNSI